jgi:hypothetical protein
LSRNHMALHNYSVYFSSWFTEFPIASVWRPGLSRQQFNCAAMGVIKQMNGPISHVPGPPHPSDPIARSSKVATLVTRAGFLAAAFHCCLLHEHRSTLRRESKANWPQPLRLEQARQVIAQSQLHLTRCRCARNAAKSHSHPSLGRTSPTASRESWIIQSLCDRNSQRQ